jgi:putative acetyltransferase
MMELRQAERSDQPALRQLIFGILAEYGLPPSPADTDADLEDLEKFYGEGNGRFFVLVDGEQVIGSVGWYRRDDATVELRKLYLHPDYRGRGLGRQLLEHAMATATERGFRRMLLETAEVLREAKALYLRYGFQPHAVPHLAPRCDLAMGCELSSKPSFKHSQEQTPLMSDRRTSPEKPGESVG